jgi:hypothetical protein
VNSRFQLVFKHGRISFTINSLSMFHTMFQSTWSTMVTLLEVTGQPNQSSPVSHSFIFKPFYPFINFSLSNTLINILH